MGKGEIADVLVLKQMKRNLEKRELEIMWGVFWGGGGRMLLKVEGGDDQQSPVITPNENRYFSATQCPCLYCPQGLR